MNPDWLRIRANTAAVAPLPTVSLPGVPRRDRECSDVGKCEINSGQVTGRGPELEVSNYIAQGIKLKKATHRENGEAEHYDVIMLSTWGIEPQLRRDALTEALHDAVFTHDSEKFRYVLSTVAAVQNSTPHNKFLTAQDRPRKGVAKETKIFKQTLSAVRDSSGPLNEILFFIVSPWFSLPLPPFDALCGGRERCYVRRTRTTCHRVCAHTASKFDRRSDRGRGWQTEIRLVKSKMSCRIGKTKSEGCVGVEIHGNGRENFQAEPQERRRKGGNELLVRDPQSIITKQQLPPSPNTL
ncbi:hypothetical protein DFH06DRAFT_1137510 [Mycena polygramma]|nr:hypothetical protein DFH06DRAFT_1137510 [Mycena polygramma]